MKMKEYLIVAVVAVIAVAIAKKIPVISTYV
jgi:hypothetical protein